MDGSHGRSNEKASQAISGGSTGDPPAPAAARPSEGLGGGRAAWLGILTWNKREPSGGFISAKTRLRTPCLAGARAEDPHRKCTRSSGPEGTPAEVGTARDMQHPRAQTQRSSRVKSALSVDWCPGWHRSTHPRGRVLASPALVTHVQA